MAEVNGKLFQSHSKAREKRWVYHFKGRWCWSSPDTLFYNLGALTTNPWLPLGVNLDAETTKSN